MSKALCLLATQHGAHYLHACIASTLVMLGDAIMAVPSRAIHRIDELACRLSSTKLPEDTWLMSEDPSWDLAAQTGPNIICPQHFVERCELPDMHWGIFQVVGKGLSALTEAQLAVPLDKSLQCSSWGLRPLTQAQVASPLMIMHACQHHRCARCHSKVQCSGLLQQQVTLLAVVCQHH